MLIKLVFSTSLLLLIDGTLVEGFKHLDQDVGEVIFVNILYRHGARTPIRPYPNDPYRNKSYWPYDWGQLTNTGKLQHYVLGNWLRNSYGNLLPNGRYSDKAIYIKSTDVDRTLMSAESNLAGFFPPGMSDKWGPIKWQPIPVHTVPEVEDKILAMKAPCKRYDEAYQRLLSSPEMQLIHQKYNYLYQYLTLQSGRKVDDLDGVEYIYSTLFIQTLANYTLPDWTKKVFPDQMEEPAALSFAVPTFTKELKRLKGGPLLKEMIDHMSEKAAGNLERNISMYSAHDTTVANLLNTLGLYNNIPPPFASTILLELRRNNNNNDYFVTVLYKNSSNHPFVLTLPGCAEACPLNRFKMLYEDLLPGDWDSECHSHDLFDLSPGQPYHSLAIFDNMIVRIKNMMNVFNSM